MVFRQTLVATSSITGDTVTSVTITNGGVGYTGSQIVPPVLFEEPRTNKEAFKFLLMRVMMEQSLDSVQQILVLKIG